MIECVQQIGYKRGVRQVFDFDKVYKVEGEGDKQTRISLGLVGHGEGVQFNPRIKLTDAERVSVVEAINQHRAKYGRGPIGGVAPAAATIGEVKRMMGHVEAIQDEDDDDE